MEEYRDVPGYEGKYQVSNLGNVKSLERRIRGALRRERVMKPSKTTAIYLQVILWEDKNKKAYRVHQLVAMAFLGHIPNGQELVVDHINGDILDNRLCNLQIITNRQNIYKSMVDGSSKYFGVDFHNATNKWQSRITYNGKRIYLGVHNTELEAHTAYTNFCIKNKIIY